MTVRRAAALGVAACLLLAGCKGDQTQAGGDAGDLGAEASVAEGWAAEVVAEGFEGPTQIVRAPDGDLWLATLSGGENEGEGRVLDLGPDGVAEPRTVLDGLQKPTGLAVVDDAVWVQLEQVVLRAPLDGDQAGDAAEVPATALPNNGRSQGTLVVLPDGRIAHEASGTGSGPDPAEGSGVVYALDPADGVAAEPEPLAEGFKGPYAFVPVGDDRLLVGDMGDGTYDGASPQEELNLVDLGGEALPSGGWPLCVGDRVPVEEHGADESDCEDTVAPLALFPPNASPTSIAVTDDGRTLVALWVEGRVVEVGDDGEVTDVATGLANPQHLLADGDDVLLTEFGSGRLLRLLPPA